MVKRTATMPKDDETKSFKMPKEGERKFQIVDIIEKESHPDKVFVKCEDLEDGASLLYNVTLDDKNDFFWLTKLFLKCIDEPHNGEVEIDTDAWIGRQFFGLVKHKDGYANIKKLMFKETEQTKEPVAATPSGSDEIAWDD